MSIICGIHVLPLSMDASTLCLKARRIMKLDPNNNDLMSSVGDDLGGAHYKYSGTVNFC